MGLGLLIWKLLLLSHVVVPYLLYNIIEKISVYKLFFIFQVWGQGFPAGQVCRVLVTVLRNKGQVRVTNHDKPSTVYVSVISDVCACTSQQAATR